MNIFPEQEPNYLYDLSNPHFENTELLTAEGKILKGQFVQFKVTKSQVEYLYPAEKYCFVTEENKKRFWKEYEAGQGSFKEIPAYVIQLSMAHIKRITILPALVP